jgi:hypothetical protein
MEPQFYGAELFFSSEHLKEPGTYFAALVQCSGGPKHSGGNDEVDEK